MDDGLSSGLSADEAAGGVVEPGLMAGNLLVEAGDLGRHMNGAALLGDGLPAGPWLWTMGGLNVKRPHCWPSRASKESQCGVPGLDDGGYKPAVPPAPCLAAADGPPGRERGRRSAHTVMPPRCTRTSPA